MRRTVQSLALMLALSASVMAGEMPCPVNSPTPTTATVAQEPSANGIMQNGEPESLTQVALDLLAALPSLF
jgi:hypothetical protein